jgi:hypothetical protein
MMLSRPYKGMYPGFLAIVEWWRDRLDKRSTTRLGLNVLSHRNDAEEQKEI